MSSRTALKALVPAMRLTRPLLKEVRYEIWNWERLWERVRGASRPGRRFLLSRNASSLCRSNTVPRHSQAKKKGTRRRALGQCERCKVT
jgi:hypothetical protein